MNKTLLLVLILMLAGFMAFIPHIGYAYPLHVDEWMHLTYAKTIAQTGAISFPDPFTGDGTVGPGSNVWLGYHVLMAMVQKVSGIDWLVLWRFGPSVIFMLTVFCVYIFANKQGYGLEAAFFACLIPTTGGLLGPSFMVPMALGLLFIPLSLYLAFYIKSWLSYLLLFLTACFLWSMHPTTAAIQGIVLLPFILLTLKGNPGRGLGLIAALLLPVLITLPLTINHLPEIGQLLVPKGVSPTPWLDLPAVLQIYGVIPLIFCFVGIIYLLKRGSKYNYGLLMGLVLLLTVMLASARFQIGIDTIFERGITTALLLIGIIAGAGLYWLRTQLVSARFLNKYKPRVAPYAGGLLCGLSVVVILAVAMPARFNVPYYHMIDDEDYRAFVWIRDNIGPEYEKALVDPWKATAFTAVSGKNVIRRIWIKQEPGDDAIYQVLADGGPNTSFMRQNRASFVYSQTPCNNPDLVSVRDNVYVTVPNIAGRFTKEDGLQNGNFESVYGKAPVYWRKWLRNCEPAFLYPQPGRDGGISVAIQMFETAPLNPLPEASWCQDIHVHEGETYCIGGWVKTMNLVGDGEARIFIGLQGADDQWISWLDIVKDIKGTKDWSYYQRKVIIPPGAVSGRVMLYMAGCSGTVWFDDIILKAE